MSWLLEVPPLYIAFLMLFWCFISAFALMWVHWDMEEWLCEEYSDLAEWDREINNFSWDVSDDLPIQAKEWLIEEARFKKAARHFERVEWIHRHLIPDWMLPLKHRIFNNWR